MHLKGFERNKHFRLGQLNNNYKKNGYLFEKKAWIFFVFCLVSVIQSHFEAKHTFVFKILSYVYHTVYVWGIRIKSAFCKWIKELSRKRQYSQWRKKNEEKHKWQGLNISLSLSRFFRNSWLKPFKNERMKPGEVRMIEANCIKMLYLNWTVSFG